MTSGAHPSDEGLRDELAALSAWLDEVDLAYRQDRRHVRVPVDAPSAVRVVWEELRFSSRLGLCSPSLSRDEGRERLQRALKRWLGPRRKMGGGEFEKLPHSFRLVRLEAPVEDFWVWVTDESEDDADPRVHGFLIRGGASSPEQHFARLASGDAGGRYSRFIATTMLDWVLERCWYRTRLCLREPLEGTQPFPRLAPALQRVGEVWATTHRAVPFDVERRPKGHWVALASASFAALVDTVAGLSEDLVLDALPPVGDMLGLRGTQWQQAPERRVRRTFVLGAGRDATRVQLGTWNGEPFWLAQPEPEPEDGRALVYVATGQRGRIQQSRGEADRSPAPREGAGAMSVAADDSLRQELQELRKLLERQLPDHVQARRPVKLSASAPASVKALWDAVGFSKALAGFVDNPDEAPSRKATLKRLTEWLAQGPLLGAWRSADGSTPEPSALLPSAFRRVEDGIDPLFGLQVTDESVSTEDPPVLQVSNRARVPELFYPSYVRYMTYRLLQAAFAHKQWRVGLQLAHEGSQPMPHLAPTLWQLADGLYQLEPLPLTGHGISLPPSFLGFESFGALVRGLVGRPEGERLVFSTPHVYGHFIEVDGLTEEQWRGWVVGRDLPVASGSSWGHVRVGTFGAVLVILGAEPKLPLRRTLITESIADQKQVLQQLKQQGAVFTTERW
ncbi:hypothetical protein [Myxococcus stipitatus]|uniref:hypothetical protein n=1 Tax=Myxococcus stipitatus TaxID=83455 RepID=UPI0030D5144B